MIIIEILSFSSEFLAKFAKNHNFKYHKMACKFCKLMQKKSMDVHEIIIQAQLDWFKFATFSPVKHIVCQTTLPTRQRAGRVIQTKIHSRTKI